MVGAAGIRKDMKAIKINPYELILMSTMFLKYVFKFFGTTRNRASSGACWVQKEYEMGGRGRQL